jgi:16S rRNA G966 N2-methylase RsmD
VQVDAIEWLTACQTQCLDIVFIDPPFSSSLHSRAIELLTAGDCVKKGGLVYLETPREIPPPALPPGWETVREKLLGEVRMQLLKII